MGTVTRMRYNTELWTDVPLAFLSTICIVMFVMSIRLLQIHRSIIKFTPEDEGGLPTIPHERRVPT